jgi:hypothetical protein
MSDAVALIRRIRAATAAGDTLGRDDAAALHAAIDVAICEGGPLLGLSGKWRQEIRIEDTKENLLRLLKPGRARAEARRVYAALCVYEAGEYRSNRRGAKVPLGERGVMHEFLNAYGSVPSQGTLRRWIENNSNWLTNSPVDAPDARATSAHGKANYRTDSIRPRSFRKAQRQAS